MHLNTIYSKIIERKEKKTQFQFFGDFFPKQIKKLKTFIYNSVQALMSITY